LVEVLVMASPDREAAPGEEGELVHAGPLVAQGYWLDEEKTRERFRPAPAISRFGGPAVWSGDRVVRGSDGLIRFRGRDDAMIKVSGNRISPTEIEEAVLSSGAAADAAAFGVSDARLGQAIILVAVPRGDDAEARLKHWLAAELPHHMQPQRIIWRTTMPLSPNGKIDRARLKEEIL
jgi:acyl-coenzyme A synthetase/AMP-(fatty) acid ligase